MFVQQRLLADGPARVSFSVPRHGLYRSSLKRPLDILLVLMALPVVLPLVLVLALVVLIDGGNPFYAQDRVGRGGRRYRMWKLRSMVVDADTRLQGHLDAHPEARAEWEETQKLRHDPRITDRRLSIVVVDESGAEIHREPVYPAVAKASLS